MKRTVVRLLSLLLTLTLLFSLVACGETTPPTDAGPIRIGVMSGPTGMGMAKLMNDVGEDESKYVFDVYSDPKTAIADLAAGTIDAVCLPTNTAAMQAKAKDDYVSVLAVNTLGSLYLLSDDGITINSLEDLEGKTVYVSVPSSTTKPILEYLLQEAGVQATVDDSTPTHDELVARMSPNAAEHVDILVLPEPKVSGALMQFSAYSIDLNLSTVWSELSDDDLAMGCLLMRNDAIRKHGEAVDVFLREYRASVEYITDISHADEAAQMIVDAGILPKLPIAKSALANLRSSIVFRDGAAMKATLISFYDAIGVPQPTPEFYYKADAE